MNSSPGPTPKAEARRRSWGRNKRRHWMGPERLGVDFALKWKNDATPEEGLAVKLMCQVPDITVKH